MKIERYMKASSIADAFAILQERPDNKIIAGGAWLKLTDPVINTAIDLSLLGLNSISEQDNEIEIGAMTTLYTLEKSAIIQKMYDGILAQAAMKIMGITIRNIATIGGCIMGKFGFSDIITPLMAMEAILVFHQHQRMTLEAFLDSKANFQDVLIKIVIPKTEARGYFHKIALTSLDFAVLNIAVSRKNSEYRIVFGSRPGVASRAFAAEQYLKELKNVSEDIINKAVDMAASECRFGTNQRGSAEYRLNLAKVYAKRGIEAVTDYEN
ncbi:MAG: FAD binding domain-containing protein [Candidatus Izemoplasmatales bacterium]|jgi:CO/xanthine dehydrogenase FAD-binding subunit